jgi:predicted glutamine amidotransferase
MLKLYHKAAPVAGRGDGGNDICRFVLYIGDEITVSSLVTEPVNSLIHQSFHSHERDEPLNGDGFGLAWYAPHLSPEPAVFKDVSPAWNNLNLINLARVVRSNCVLAHVRAATPGLPVIQLNCHPFTWGPLAFMHNGRVGGFKSIRRDLIRRLSDEAFQSVAGSTDTEYVFALFQDHYMRQGRVVPQAEAMAAALTATIREVEELTKEAGVDEPSLLNLAVTDGKSAVVTRHNSHMPEEANSLHVHAGTCFVCSEGVFRMLDPQKGRGAVIVASEPLSEDKDWIAVKPNSMVVVHEDLKVESRELKL